MKEKRIFIGIVCSLALLVSLGVLTTLPVHPAAAAEVAGVTLPDEMDIGGKTTPLVGIGLRKKMIIKVYAAALYMEGSTPDAARILGADEARGLLMHFIYKKVDTKSLKEAWEDGFKNNTPGASDDLKARMDEFVAMFDEDALKGEQILMVYQPGTGTTVTIKGQEKGPIPGADFASALFAIWFGDKPADKGLKKNVLAGKR
jgi:hypothetical protein